MGRYRRVQPSTRLQHGSQLFQESKITFYVFEHVKQAHGRQRIVVKLRRIKRGTNNIC